jgi:hypothetical protein
MKPLGTDGVSRRWTARVDLKHVRETEQKDVQQCHSPSPTMSYLTRWLGTGESENRQAGRSF